MNLGTFETHVEPLVLERARCYYREGRVGNVEEIAPQLFHAAVDGTNLYDVDIRIKGSEVASAACTCPYSGDGLCKHIAATLMEIRAMRTRSESPRPDDELHRPSTFPHETYDTVMTYLNTRMKKDKPKDLDSRHPKRSAKSNAPNLDTASAQMLNGLSFSPEEEYDDWNSFAEYDDNDYSGLEKTLETINSTGDAAQACMLALYGIEILLSLTEAQHEPDYRVEELLDLYENALQNCCNDLSERSAPELKHFVFHMLIAATRETLITGWGKELTLVYAAIPLCDKWDGCGVLLNRIDEIAADKGYEEDVCAVAHYRLLEHVGRKKDAEKYRKANRFKGPFLREYVEEALLAHDISSARDLLEEGLCLKAQAKKAKRKPTVWQGFERDTFPNGFFTYLEATYEEQEDKDALLRLYRYYLLQDFGSRNTAYLDKLRKLSGDTWPNERDKLVEENLAAPHPGSFFPRLLREEHLTEAALRYCTSKPDRILQMYRLVGTDYPEETKALLLDVLEPMLRTTSGRETYREACKVIQKYQSLFGTDEALAIANSFEKRYSNRRALREELESLKNSWM